MCLIVYYFLLSFVLKHIYSCLYIYIYIYIYALHDYPSSTWFMTFLSVWDTHSFPCSNSHSSIDPFLILIFLDVFKTLLCIFHFIAIFLIQLGCIVWSQTTISLYYVCSSTKLVIRSRI